jgi:hypothetical protein
MKKLLWVTDSLQKSWGTSLFCFVIDVSFKRKLSTVLHHDGKQQNLSPPACAGETATAAGFPVLVDGRHHAVRVVYCLRGDGI